MLRIIQNSTAAGAKSYYSTADYYTQGQELTGVWRGKGAERLGLVGDVEKADWDALCDNRDPSTGETLTIRQKSNRRVGYDFNFHVPKSVSVLYALTEDSRILEAFRSAVNATMQDMESEMATRVRSGGSNADRTTGNMVWGEFVHTTARPVDGVPDPHLHAHCFVFNTTWDEAEQRWKAGQFAGLKRDAPYFEAVFHSRLSRSLAELGLPIVRSRKGWELAGMPASIVGKFSRRTAQIEKKAQEKGITDPGQKGELGAKTRRAKTSELTTRQLKQGWQERLTPDEDAAVRLLAERVGGDAIPEDDARPAEAASLALSHCFERRSVVPERVLQAEALKRAYGGASFMRVADELSARPLLRGERHGQAVVTTPEVLAEEKAMLAFAREGRGTCRALVPGEHAFRREWLNPDQRRATQHILGSHDRVILLRGGAGTGKTSMAAEAVEAIEAAGTSVFMFAPSAEASRGVLRAEGFANADTVQRLLIDEKMQEQVRGQLIWVDEAGLLGSRQMAQLFALADRLDARLVLAGDRRQHGSVERGAALRLLEEEAGLVPAQMREIVRQASDYKRAVSALSRGRTSEGFRELDRLGWIREVDEGERYRMLAADYVGAVAAGCSALVVSPTHREGERITGEVRAALKAAGQIGKEERSFEALTNLNLTEAERRDAASYLPGDVLVFHQNATGHCKGDRLRVGVDRLPLDQAERFGVFRPQELEVAAGDVLRITRNGTTADGRHRLNNGALYTVEGFDEAGHIRLTNGWTIDRKFGHIAHGYCVTSHASQGKTVDRVFVGMSAQSLPATSAEQFYVTASRGRKQVVVYTDDKQALLEAVGRSDDRVTATEMLRHRLRSAEPTSRDSRTRTTKEPVRG